MNLPSSRISWLDNIRIFACILVIASHIVGQFFVSPPFTPDNETFAWSSFYTVLVRVSIPLFFMISGALLLPVRDTTGQFLKKRFTRVLFPFLLWSAFYTVFPWSYETLTGDSFHSVFPLSRVTPDLETMGTNLLLIPLKFSVGIHLFQTIFPSYLGKCPWNEYGALHSFSGYLGYMVLGCFLRKYSGNASFARTACWAVPCLAAAFWFTLHFYRTSTAQARSSSGDYIGFASINVALMSVAVFVLFQSLPAFRAGSAPQRLLADFSSMSFGIYLVHFVLVGAVYRLFGMLHLLFLPASLSIPLLTAATCLAAWGIIKLLSFLPGSRYLIG